MAAKNYPADIPKELRDAIDDADWVKALRKGPSTPGTQGSYRYELFHLHKRIAELEAENESLQTGVHSCHDKCPRIACVQGRRIRELEETIVRDAANYGADRADLEAEYEQRIADLKDELHHADVALASCQDQREDAKKRIAELETESLRIHNEKVDHMEKWIRLEQKIKDAPCPNGYDAAWCLGDCDCWKRDELEKDDEPTRL